MKPGLWAIALFAIGCQTSGKSTPPVPLGASEPGVEVSEDKPVLSRDMERARLAVRALGSIELDPLKRREQACNDAELSAAAPTEPARVITTRFAEARLVAKALLPMTVTEPLELPRLPLLEAALSGVHGEEASREALERSTALSKRRFVGVFHVTQFGLPRWIWRLDHKKPEWVRGYLETWLALHDGQSGERLCQTRIWVVSDGKDAPLSRRLRADTRNKLTRALGHALKREAPAALRRLSRVLTLPEPTPALALRR